ncbi:MAG: carboxylating nicotinate-nucleotide diphosphorylase [Dehalococcoidia bacterium]
MSANRDPIDEIIERALVEDLGEGDVTTDSLVPVDWYGVGCIVVKAKGILAGADLAVQVFQRVDPELQVDLILEDGARVGPGNVVARLTGSIAGILKGERVALNFLQRLSGIATETSRYVEGVEGLPVRIMDTRKTTPGLRSLEKYAVRVGGGHNHRTSLSDGILIKDNHLAALRARGLTMKDIVGRARQNAPQKSTIEVEVTSVAESLEAVEAGADIVMLDNMNPVDMRDAVKAVHGRALVEASGGITLENVRAVAETGVDMISIGALTHSVRALDISLELEI